MDPVELMNLLHQNFLNTLIIDVSVEPSGLLPGSRSFPFLQKHSLNQIHHPRPLDEKELYSYKIFDQRIGNYVIVYDELGLENGQAFKVCEWIKKEKAAKACYYLKGGLEALLAQFPAISRSIPLHVDKVNRNHLGSLYGIPGEYPIGFIQEYQRGLIEAVWYGTGDTKGDFPNIVIPNSLYLSSCYSCKDSVLSQYGISKIIRLGWGFSVDCEAECFDFPIQDSPTADIRGIIEDACSLIQEFRNKKHVVLVHCHAGVSRSSTIIIAYLMKFCRISLYDAWNIVFKTRPIIRPNHGFAKTLCDLEMELFGIKEPTLKPFWMSESYLFYMDYIEFMYRASSVIE